MKEQLDNEKALPWNEHTSMCEIELAEPDDFNKIVETLTRIGIPSEESKTLFQSCHLLHKRGRYYIVHFKEMFLMDGKPSKFTEYDLARRNTIATLLSDWGLVANIITPEDQLVPQAPMSCIKIISYKAKPEWTLVPKYTIGKK